MTKHFAMRSNRKDVVPFTSSGESQMKTDWARIFNRLWEVINPADQSAPTYFSGGRFITVVREIDPYFPDYGQYIEQRRSSGCSTTRRDYFYDIFAESFGKQSIRVCATNLGSRSG